MNANLQTLQSLVQSQRSRTSGAADAGANGLGDALGAQQGGKASFASWMSQMQEARMPQGTPEAAKAPVASRPEVARAQAAQRSAPAQTQLQARAAADKADAAAAERNRQAQRAGQAKPAQAAKPASHQATKSPDGAESPDQAASAGDETARTETAAAAQGEATAPARESQPSSEAPLGDPAAMLAWLAQLTQTDAATPQPAGGDAAAVAPAQGNAEALRGTGLPGAGGEGRGGPAGLGDPAATLAKALAQGTGTEEAAGMDASLAENLAVQEAPLEFSALMAREVGRAAGPAAPASEGARHFSGSLSTPVDSPDFQQALADRVRLWVSGPATEGPMTAELRLNPADMGPIQIRIQLDGQAAQVDFAAAHADTREAIEASLPALSSALEEAGLSLAGGGVSDQAGQQAWAGRESFQDRQPAWRSADGSRSEAGTEPPAAAATAAPRPVSRAGGLDLYA